MGGQIESGKAQGWISPTKADGGAVRMNSARTTAHRRRGADKRSGCMKEKRRWLRHRRKGSDV
jgi:hypothetical protein